MSDATSKPGSTAPEIEKKGEDLFTLPATTFDPTQTIPAPSQTPADPSSSSTAAATTAEDSLPVPPFGPSLSKWNQTCENWLVDKKEFTGLAAGAIVFDAQNRVLLVQRAPHDSMPLRWEAPGGGVAWSENVLAACARELREESGLVARRMVREVTVDPACVDVTFVSRSGVRGWRVMMEVEVEEGGQVKLDPEEHVDYVWAEEGEVREGRMGDGKEIPVTKESIKEFLLEAFRLRREG